MGFPTIVYEEAMNNKRLLRQKNSALRDIKLQSLYDAVPRVREIDEQMSKLGAKAAMTALSGNLRFVNSFRVESEKLKSERDKLTAGIDCTVPFECEKCQDSGVIGGEYCDCIEKAAQQIYYRELCDSMPLTDCRFDNFSLEYYSDTPDEYGISPLKRMKGNLEYLKDYAENFDKSKNLMLVGGAGLGKTHLALAVANVVISKGFGVYHAGAQNLLNNLERERYGKINPKYSYFDAVKDCDLLILDDLGVEFLTSFGKAEIIEIIDTRLLTKKATVITTNLSIREIEEKYTPRVASRIIGDYKSLLFKGDDIRQKKML